jgi:hypothetical protein
MARTDRSRSGEHIADEKQADGSSLAFRSPRVALTQLSSGERRARIVARCIPPSPRASEPRELPMLTEATTPPLDLLLVGGTVVDPSQGLHARKDVGLAQGRVALVEDSIPTARARQVVDCSGLIVTPGLVDLHVHVYEGASHYGIDVDSTCLATGATRVPDLRSAGAWTLSAFRWS